MLVTAGFSFEGSAKCQYIAFMLRRVIVPKPRDGGVILKDGADYAQSACTAQQGPAEEPHV